MKLKFLQEGGQMPVEQGVPAPQQANPEEQIAQMASQIVQQIGPEAAGLLADAIIQIIQGSAQPAATQPQFARKGGKLQRI